MTRDHHVRMKASLRRPGRVWWGTIGAVLFVGAAVALGATFLGAYWGDNGDEATTAILHPVNMALFEHFVIERGDLESANNEDIRCQVKSEGTTGTAILKIVPSGTIVKQGEFLIQFDDSALRTQLTQQRIYVANAQAAKTQNETALKTAEATLKEYVNGTSKQEQELARGEVFVAEENLRRAEEYLRFAERLAARNYINAVQLEAERFSVQKAGKDLEAARTKLDVLREHTYQKMVAQLNGGIAQARALLTASEATLGLETSRLNILEDQVAKCHVVAPSDGQVVYATSAERRRDEEIVIEEGALIREGQTVIRLPDATNMQVRAVVNESRINLVRPGATAKIELDSEPGVLMDGNVETVDAFPMSRRWSSSTKEYGAIVKITGTMSPNLRPGLRAKVTIFVAREPNALQVPVQSVVERNGANYCLLAGGNSFTAKPVEVGPNNDKFVVIRQGLSQGDQVALDATRYADGVEFPAATTAAVLADRGHDGRPDGRPAGRPDGRGAKRGNGRAASGG